MRFLMFILGFFAVIYGIAGLPFMYEKGIGYFIYALFLEIAMLIGLYVCRKKYYTPERKQANKEKQESFKRQQAAIKAVQEIEKKKRTTIITTHILNDSKTRQYKIFSAKKRCVLFWVKYEDGHTEEKEARPGTAEYNLYMFYLDRRE